MRGGNKYGAQRVTVDGVTFDSKAEARRWSELRLEERAGMIRELERQKRFRLHAKGGALVGVYIADFAYVRAHDGVPVVEDVKGMKRTTDLFAWKRRHLKAEYGLDVVEVRRR